MREHLLGDLRAAGLTEDQARAEAERILAGDVWGG
ncbi:polysaccharide biosynthesis/export family protein [Sinomonas humi]|nr:polysaccharide biosynthesis/export family protein [Sinomonas humi]